MSLTKANINAITKLAQQGIGALDQAQAALESSGTIAAKIVRFIGAPADESEFTATWAEIRAVLDSCGISTKAAKGTAARKFYQAAAMAASRLKLELGFREVAETSKKTGAATGSKRDERASAFESAEASTAAAGCTAEAFASFMAAAPSAVLREWASQFKSAETLCGFFGYRAPAAVTTATKAPKAKPAKAD
jgi:hypothetical protein